MEIDVAALPLPYVYLALCVAGWPVPLPEDVLVMGAGWKASQSGQPLLTLLTCYAGVLTRDTSVFLCARLFGRRLLTLPLLGRLLAGDRRERLERWIRKDGRKTVFLARFLPAVRVPTFFTCASIGMSAAHFFAIDALAAAISVPLNFALGYFVGPPMIAIVRDEPAARVVLVVLAVLFVVVVVRRAVRAVQSPQAS